MPERPIRLDGRGMQLIPIDRKNALATKMVRSRGKIDAASVVALVFTAAWPADRTDTLLVALAIVGLFMVGWARRNRRRRRELLALALPAEASRGRPHA